MNVCVRAIMLKRFVSKVRRASERGTSRAGRVQFLPLFFANEYIFLEVEVLGRIMRWGGIRIID